MVAAVVVGALIASVVVLATDGGVSKEEFIDQTDAICAQKRAEADELTDPTDLESTGTFFSQIVPILEDQISEIRALEAPEDDRDVLDQWLDTQERLVEIFGRAADAASAGDQPGFDEAFADANAAQLESSRLAEEFGFEVCGATEAG